MDLITLDFETYYSKDYSLSKMTTEEYIRDPRFQVIGVSTKFNDEPTQWVTGKADRVLEHLHGFDWDNAMLVAHNTMFDGAILSWRCGIKPKALADTLSMSRAVYGTEVSHSLKALAERRGVGVKGDEVTRTLGKRRADFKADEMARFGAYAKLDVDLCYDIFHGFMEDGFPTQEMKLIDLTLRMFTDPVLELDAPHLRKHLAAVQERKKNLLVAAGVKEKKDLMSNPKFANMLREHGVEPPMKISPTTGKETYAFAKTDEEFRALEEHELVGDLISARLGNKSTLEETRTERFLGIAKRGKLPVPIRYYAAHTGRWGGADKINLQNLPSRGPNAKQIKQSIVAPSGYVLIDGDLSQIEARMLAWLSGQEDLVTAFRNKEDVYKIMASAIYGVPVEEVTGPQRFVGKTTILGCGYGMGADKFRWQSSNMGVDLTEDEAQHIITTYRRTYPAIPDFWKVCNKVLENLYAEKGSKFGVDNLLRSDGKRSAVVLPSGLSLLYPDLQAKRGEYGPEYTYKTRNARKKIYGGMLTENICQALARIVIGEQMLLIAKKYRVAMTVHDSIVVCVREEEVDNASAYVEQCMRHTPAWATDLPVDCELEVGERYGG